MATEREIKESLLDIINTTTVPALKGVFGFESSTPKNGYPYATITLLGWEDEVVQTNLNKRVYNFVIRIFQERLEVNFGKEKAEEVIEEAKQDIMAILDANQNLSNPDVLYLEPSIVDAGYSPDATEREIDINLKIVTTKIINL